MYALIPASYKQCSHRLKTAVALFASLALVACIGSGSTGDDVAGGVAGGQENDIYYSTQAAADADLNRFELDNPSCQLWTNWQKMCSRTGSGGKAVCVLDEDMPVRPSKPFCDRASDPVPSVPLADHPDDQQKLLESPAARLSRNRFCVAYYADDPSMTSFEHRESGAFKGIPFCVEFASNRPFNGERGSLARHPACDEWSNFGDGLWFCIKPKKPTVCDDLTIGVPVPSESEGPITVGTSVFTEGRAIWGLHCKGRRNQ